MINNIEIEKYFKLNCKAAKKPHSVGISKIKSSSLENWIFDKFMGKNRENPVIKNIRFHSVKHIKEVFELILE